MSTPIGVVLLAIGAHAAVLWLAQALAASGRGRPPLLDLGLTLVAAGMVASVAVSSMALAATALSGMAALAAAAWAASTVLAARWAQLQKFGLAVAAGILSLFAGFLASVVAWPLLFQASAPLAAVAGGVGTLLATAGTFGLHLALPLPGRLWLLRPAGAACVAVLLAGPWLAMPGPVAMPELDSLLGPGLGLLICVLLATGLLLATAQSAPMATMPVSTRVSGRAQAALDSLTQLPTRVYFEPRLAKMARVCDTHGRRLALFFIDLDGFKPVNDTFGHQTGDQVLEQVGQRLRKLSGRKGLAARIGGDEFLLLLSEAGNDAALVQAAKHIITTLSEPYKVQERSLVISCSVGIAVYPDECSPAALITRADAAMYAAKRAGGSRHCMYTPDLDESARVNFELLADLRNAVSQGQFELQYQPKIDARTGQVTAAEALLRWNHPQRGLIMPDAFIEVAERFGLIGVIGDWVVNDACRQVREWRDKGLRMRVAVNLSVHQMRQDDIAERIAQALQRYGVHPSLLTCEITESAAMEDTRATQETFRLLGELGAHLSIDDFGTGYSSLAYLRKLPASELKIDRSMVTDIEHSEDACAVVNAVVQLAHALGLKVVAEGVENARQQQLLVNLGCDELQGYLYARPMSARALLLWALGEQRDAPTFRPSLFGETRTVVPARKPLRRGRLQSGPTFVPAADSPPLVDSTQPGH